MRTLTCLHSALTHSCTQATFDAYSSAPTLNTLLGTLISHIALIEQKVQQNQVSNEVGQIHLPEISMNLELTQKPESMHCCLKHEPRNEHPQHSRHHQHPTRARWMLSSQWSTTLPTTFKVVPHDLTLMDHDVHNLPHSTLISAPGFLG